MTDAVKQASSALVFLQQAGDLAREGLMPFLFCVALIYFGRVLINLSRKPQADSLINLEDLLIGEDGKTSRSAFVMLVALMTTTWMMVYLTMRDKMSEGYFGLYSTAWIFPTVARLIWNPDNKPTVTLPTVQKVTDTRQVIDSKTTETSGETS